ncbi:MAG: cytochrome c maturation protein CcmE [Acidimicrobiales bacterium]
MTAPASDPPTLEDEDLPPIVTTRRPRQTSRGRVIVSAVVALAAIGFLVSKGLGSATVYFKTADEAVAQRQQLGTDRFRIEGSVQAGTIRQEDGRLLFMLLGEQGAMVPVVHTGGQPTGLFKESIPVVLEGHFDGAGAYASDKIIVKHSETYRAQNPNRVADYVPPAPPSL